MHYCFDLDETICATPQCRTYALAVPYYKVINSINDLHDQGHFISIFTARGSSSGVDYHDLTSQQLKQWGVKYHLLVDKGKPSYDVFVDDKAVNTVDWRARNNICIVGFVASCFDFLHAGHCLMLEDAKNHCDHLIAALQVDPSLDRPHKNKPVLSLQEREIMLRANRYVDEIVFYNTESDLETVLSRILPDIRFLGSDYKGIEPTGYKYCTNIYYHDRNHTYSSTDIRSRLKSGN